MATKKTKEKKVEPATAPFWEGSPVVRAAYQRLIVMWIVALLLTGVQFFIAYRWFRPSVLLADGRPQILLIALAALGIIEFLLSIWLWRGILQDAVAKRDLGLAAKGYITAWLLCLAAGPLGFVIALSSDGRYYYGFFVLAALGVLYHQPAKETLGPAAPLAEPKTPRVEPAVAAEAPLATQDESPAEADDPAGTNTYFSDSDGGNDVAQDRTPGNS